MSAVLTNVPEEMDPEYVEGLRQRCLERVGFDSAKAERLVAATVRGWEEADRAWRDRRVA